MRPDRNEFLAAMTDEVAELVLRNNYLQTLCLSIALAQGTAENGYAMQLMRSLEKSGLLDRKLEWLPSDAAIIERDLKGGTLTRPELAVLMAYAKIALVGKIVDSDVPDDPYLSRELRRYFPKAMQERFAEEIESHKLRREIIATMLANSMINRGGPSFVTRLSRGDRTDAGGDRRGLRSRARQLRLSCALRRDRRARCEDPGTAAEPALCRTATPAALDDDVVPPSRGARRRPGTTHRPLSPGLDGGGEDFGGNRTGA